MARDSKNDKDREATVWGAHELFAPHPSTPTSDTDTQQTHDTQEIQDTQDPQDKQHTQRLNLESRGPAVSGCSSNKTDTATKKSTPSLDDYKSIREVASSPLHLYLKLDWIYEGFYPWTVDERPKTPMWNLAHNARALPELHGLTAQQAWERIDQWCQSRQRLWDEDFGAESHTDGSTEFMHLWDEIERPAGEDSLSDALKLAEMKPITLCAEHRRNELYQKLMGIALHLQKARPGEPICLPSHKVAEYVGCSPDSVARCCKIAVRQGLLKPGKPAVRFEKAAEYTFAVERFDEKGVEIPVAEKAVSGSQIPEEF